MCEGSSQNVIIRHDLTTAQQKHSRLTLNKLLIAFTASINTEPVSIQCLIKNLPKKNNGFSKQKQKKVKMNDVIKIVTYDVPLATILTYTTTTYSLKLQLVTNFFQVGVLFLLPQPD